MPYANPETSFEAAASHLFRHINDLDVLRKNPLLRSYFASTKKRGSGAVLEGVHAQILTQTDALCEQLAAKGRRGKPRRQRDIVDALCAGEPALETAARLHISRSHYYRERRAICTRVAWGLMRSASSPTTRSTVSDDPLRLLFTRAESLADRGCSYKAVSILEDAYSCISEGFAKSATGLQLAQELTFLGCNDRAAELLARSTVLTEHQGAENIASEWLCDSLALNKARLECQLRRDVDDGCAVEELARRRIAEQRADYATFDVLLFCGVQYRNTGRYREARNMLRHLHEVEQKLPRSFAEQQIALALLTAYCVEDSNDEFGLAERSLKDALELSISTGMVLGALLAMCGLISHEATRGRDDEVYAIAEEALRTASGMDCARFLGDVAVEIVTALLRTRYWRAAKPLVFEVERLVAAGSRSYTLLKQAQGSFLMRTGRHDKARAVLLAAYKSARKLGNRKLEGLILRDRAIALYRSDLENDRADLMKEAVQLIEQYGSAGDLLMTYDLAARLLGDRRSLRLAHQAKVAIVACGEALRSASRQVRDGDSQMPTTSRARRPKPFQALRLPVASG